MAEKNVHGLAIMGALGEGPKMTDGERSEIIKLFRRTMPADMHLVVGTRAPATDPAKMQAQKARDLGADALLLGPHGSRKTKRCSNITSRFPTLPAFPVSSTITRQSLVLPCRWS